MTKPALEKFKVEPQPHPVSRLRDGGYDLSRIKTVILSHKHFDHFGNLETVAAFDPLVVVGPGSLAGIGKGYPEDEKSIWPSGWLKDRRFAELPQPTEKKGDKWTVEGREGEKQWEKMACFEEGVDWFGDGSFWLIHAPGVSGPNERGKER